MPNIGEKQIIKDERTIYVQYYVRSGWVSDETYNAYVTDFNGAAQTINDHIDDWKEFERKYKKKEKEIKDNLKNTATWKQDVVNVRTFSSLLSSASGSLDGVVGTTKKGLETIANEVSADINSAKGNANSAISAIGTLKGRINNDVEIAWTANSKLTKKVNDNIDKQKLLVRDLKELIRKMKKARLEIIECRRDHKKSAYELAKQYNSYNGTIPIIPAEYEKYEYITEGSSENLPY